MEKEIIAMLLAGGQGSQVVCIDTEAGKTCSSIWREIPYHRFSAYPIV